MIRRFKNFIKRLLGGFGLVIFKRSTGIYIAEEETATIALRLCGISRPFVIDGGAHRGALVDAMRRVAPECRFMCIEPDPSLVAYLRQRFASDAHIDIVQAALGNFPGKAVLNINRSRACNSLEPVSSAAAGGLQELMTLVEQVEVPVTTLDSEIERCGKSCDILKLDLQGHDLEALKGAERLLRSVRVVIVEVWYAPVYREKVTYRGIAEFMEQHGFSLYTLVGLHYSTADRLLWSDAIFVRADSACLSQPINIT